MLPLTNALRSRICLAAPHLLAPKTTSYPTHSRFLARRSARPQFALSSGSRHPGCNHQLLKQSVTAKWNSWIRSIGDQAKVVATTSIPSDAEDKPSKAVQEKPFRRLLSLANPERSVIGASVACLCVSSAVTMSVPYCIGKILDIIFTDSFMAEKLSTFCLGMIGVFVVGSAANFGRIYLMNGACE